MYKISLAAEIFRQLEAVFVEDFLDTADGRSKKIDKIIVANRNDISENANKCLNDKFRGRITILDGRDVQSLMIANEINFHINRKRL